jgi:hypothetical protein
MTPQETVETIAMNPELKSKWLTALRSGEYPQTTGVLRDNKGFCCLGVLCDVMDNSKWSDTVGGDGYGYYFDSREDETNIPAQERKELGLHKMVKPPLSEQYDEQLLETVLIEMNDSHNQNFLEIATFIEANL